MRRKFWALLGAALLTLPLTAPAYAQPGKDKPLAQEGPAVAIHGFVWFDSNGNGVRESNEPMLSNVAITAQLGPQQVTQAVSQPDGTYTLTVNGPGPYTLEASLMDTSDTGHQFVVLSSPPAIDVVAANQTDENLGLRLTSRPHDARFFAQTGFRIDNDVIWNYFQARGGVATFGYPVSRAFQFLGFWTQIFQRQMIQIGGSSGLPAHPMNLLDPDLMPITNANGSAFPAFDSGMAGAAPPPNAANYGDAVSAFLQAKVPNSWNGQPVNFLNAYTQAAPAVSGANPALVALELWGFPTSAPAADPHNGNFVYQRFQRGILHYDATKNVTQGILLADYFKSVLTGQNLPSDVQSQMSATPYLKLYDPTLPDAVARQANSTQERVSGTTVLAYAFFQE